MAQAITGEIGQEGGAIVANKFKALFEALRKARDLYRAVKGNESDKAAQDALDRARQFVKTELQKLLSERGRLPEDLEYPRDPKNLELVIQGWIDP